MCRALNIAKPLKIFVIFLVFSVPIIVKIQMVSSSITEGIVTSMMEKQISLENQSDLYIELYNSSYDIVDSQPGQDLWHTFLLILYQDIQFWRNIFIYLGSVLTGIGVTLNILCIIIFSKSKLFRNSSFPYYVYILAIVDTLNILFRFAIPQLIESYIRFILASRYNVGQNEIDTYKYDLYTSRITSGYHCSIFLYFYNSLTLISVWLMAAVSFERWVVIKITIQTKHMIKLRAFLILMLIFLTIFTLNIFDLTPGLYIKPQWYANLTLFCERDDINSKSVYKQLGLITFNTETFAFVRTLLQTVVPFLLVLYFNSLIIYNFKKIKQNAFNASAENKKSNNCLKRKWSDNYKNKIELAIPAAVESANLENKNKNTNKDKEKEKEKESENEKEKEKRQQATSSHLCTPNRLLLGLHSCTAQNSHTNLMAALNLADNGSDNANVITKSMSPSDIESNELANQLNQSYFSQATATDIANTQMKISLNKMYDNSFLMPPNFMKTNRNCSPSFGASSDKLSVATTSNLTATTNLNQTNSNTNIGRVDKQLCFPSEPSDVLRNSKMIISVKPVVEEDFDSENGGLSEKKTITTQTSRKFLSKRRNNKHKLNRETDIMLIVLSFSILISQLPCAVGFYLIYYRNLLQGWSIYMSARTPIVLYILRLVEIIYFSLNFFFYIALSPTLRREIISFLRSYNSTSFFSKNKMSDRNRKRQPIIDKLDSQIDKHHEEMNNLLSVSAAAKKADDKMTKTKNEPNRYQVHEYSNNNSFLDYEPVSQNQINASSMLNINCTDDSNSKRLGSYSSGEYYEFIQKLGSLSPQKNAILNDDFEAIKNDKTENDPKSQAGLLIKKANVQIVIDSINGNDNISLIDS